VRDTIEEEDLAEESMYKPHPLAMGLMRADRVIIIGRTRELSLGLVKGNVLRTKRELDRNATLHIPEYTEDNGPIHRVPQTAADLLEVVFRQV
jgi:hypothetical protein